MALVVKLRDVVDQLEILNDQLPAYLNKHTGELIAIPSEEFGIAEAGDDLDSYPDWQREEIQKVQEILGSDNYLQLPTQFERQEYSIVQQFCAEIEDAELSNELLSKIRGSGAFQRFKQAIHHYDLAIDWYLYRQQALEEVAINWLNAHSITYEID
jgi:Uncharacterised protein family (UPF0158)